MGEDIKEMALDRGVMAICAKRKERDKTKDKEGRICPWKLGE